MIGKSYFNNVVHEGRIELELLDSLSLETIWRLQVTESGI